MFIANIDLTSQHSQPNSLSLSAHAHIYSSVSNCVNVNHFVTAFVQQHGTALTELHIKDCCFGCLLVVSLFGHQRALFHDCLSLNLALDNPFPHCGPIENGGRKSALPTLDCMGLIV